MDSDFLRCLELPDGRARIVERQIHQHGVGPVVALLAAVLLDERLIVLANILRIRPRYREPAWMGIQLMPWTMGGLFENHVSLTPLPPHTIVTTEGVNPLR